MVTCRIVTGAPLLERLTLALVARRYTSAALVSAEWTMATPPAPMSTAAVSLFLIMVVMTISSDLYEG